MDSSILENAEYYDGTAVVVRISEDTGIGLIYRVPYVDPEYPEFNAGPQSGKQCMILMNLCSPTLPESSPLVKIRRVLSRLENPSHILCWTKSECELGEEAPINVIDLPRLKLEFKPGPSPVEDGKFVLFCTSFT